MTSWGVSPILQYLLSCINSEAVVRLETGIQIEEEQNYTRLDKL